MNKDMIKAVIFDLDGTLLDTIGDLSDSMNYILSAYGFPEHTQEEIKSYVGNGLHKLVERAVPAGTDSARIDEMFRALVAYYRAHCAVKTRPYEGIPALLSSLRHAGIQTAVISNKADNSVQALAEEMFENAFDFALGQTEGVPLKPDAAMVNLALEKLACKADEAVYVGDSEVDIETARNAKMPCISVTWGFRTKDVLLKNGAEHFADRPEEILRIIRAH